MRSFDIFDVISNNHYGEDPHIVCFGYLFKEAGRPIMLSEFSFRGEDMGNQIPWVQVSWLKARAKELST